MAADIRLDDTQVVVEGGGLRVEGGELELDRAEFRVGAGGAQRRALMHGAADTLFINGPRHYTGGVKIHGPAQAVDDLSVPVRTYGRVGTSIFSTEMVAVGAEIENLRAVVEEMREQMEVLQVFAGIKADAPHYTQEGWRYCSKCSNLTFGPNAARSVCPKDDQPHDTTNSSAYILFPHRSRFGRQPDWKWCRKCQGLSYGAEANVGSCPVGGKHDRSTSPNYVLWTDAIPQGNYAPRDFNGQPGWRYCTKCAGLFHESNSGVCPADKGSHAYVGNGIYHLMW